MYDSGSLMEEILKEYYANIFNSEASDDGSAPQVLDWLRLDYTRLLLE